MEEAAPTRASGRRRSIAKALRRGRSAPPQARRRSCSASVFPFSGRLMVRLWLSSGGLDPDRDVRLTIVPPPHTVAIFRAV